MSVRIGILSFAHMHAFSYAHQVTSIPEAVLVGVADHDLARGRAMAEKFGARCFDGYEDILRADVDAVIVTSENFRHKDLVVMAAEAGKHVLCEKPISVSVPDAREMIDACDRNGVKLMTAFPCRYHPAMVRLKEAIDGGCIGDVLAIKGTNRGRNPGGWFIDPKQSGGGAVMDHTVHVLDLMRWVLRCEATEVYAEIGNALYKGDYDDTGMLTVTFENGVFATIDTSWSRPNSFPTWGDVTMLITGTNGIVMLDMFAQNMVLYHGDSEKVEHVNWGSDIDYGLIKDFVTTVGADVPVSITGEDGLKAMEVALGAYRSAQTGAPVKLPLGD